jgi:hypothetical protein
MLAVVVTAAKGRFAAAFVSLATFEGPPRYNVLEDCEGDRLGPRRDQAIRDTWIQRRHALDTVSRHS